jgi:hypothetical protein
VTIGKRRAGLQRRDRPISEERIASRSQASLLASLSGSVLIKSDQHLDISIDRVIEFLVRIGGRVDMNMMAWLFIKQDLPTLTLACDSADDDTDHTVGLMVTPRAWRRRHSQRNLLDNHAVCDGSFTGNAVLLS